MLTAALPTATWEMTNTPSAHSPSARSVHVLKPHGEDERRALLYLLQDYARRLEPNNKRIQSCGRRVAPHRQGVAIKVENGRAAYHGVMRCGSLYSCPTCAARITEQRRIELTSAFDTHPEYRPYLLTLTMRHKYGESLKRGIDDIQGAWEFMKSGRAWQAFKTRWYIVGTIRALEVTHGRNGWHPHFHILLVSEGEWERHELDQMQAELEKLWLNALKHHGRNGQDGVAAKVTNSEGVKAYIAKYGTEESWNAVSELTKSGVKHGRTDGQRTPFQILASTPHSHRDRKLWHEYHTTMKGRRQLIWSRGLRELLGVGKERPDEELAQEEPTEAPPMAVLSRTEWRVVVKARWRSLLLDAAEAGQAVLDTYLAYVRSQVVKVDLQTGQIYYPSPFMGELPPNVRIARHRS